jgi:hypothetical protein
VQNLARLLVAVVVDLSSEHATEQAQSLLQQVDVLQGAGQYAIEELVVGADAGPFRRRLASGRAACHPVARFGDREQELEFVRAARRNLGIEEKPAAFQASWRLACLDAGRAQDAVPSHGREHETVSVDLGVDRARVRLDQTAYGEHRSEVGGNVQLEVEPHVLVVMTSVSARFRCIDIRTG